MSPIQKKASLSIMTNLLKSVVLFFEENDWKFEVVPDDSAVVVGFQGEHGKWKCYSKARDEEQQVVFYSLFPTKVSKDRIQFMSELLSRANYGIVIGNFELDYDDGEVRYKTSIDVEGEQLTSSLMDNIVCANVDAMDAYFPAIQAVIDGKLSPQEAIKFAEDSM
jgi:hypothetical protein